MEERGRKLLVAFSFFLSEGIFFLNLLFYIFVGFISRFCVGLATIAIAIEAEYVGLLFNLPRTHSWKRP